MNVQDFVSEALVSIVRAIDVANSELNREVKIGKAQNGIHLVEFDIASGVERSAEGKVGIKVLEFVDFGEASAEYKNSTVSRIKFSVFVNPETREFVENRTKEFDEVHKQSSG